MYKALHLTIKPSVIESSKALKISTDLFEFGETTLSKFEISDIRYGIKAIRGYRFRIGRIYCIDVKSVTGTIVKIRLKSLYGIRKTKLEEKYKLILKALFENYFNDISTAFMDYYYSQREFDIAGVKFTELGIYLSKSGNIITWNDLGSKTYRSYYSLFPIGNPLFHRTFQYLTDWNTVLL